MSIIEALCFEVWGPFGAFRVPSSSRGFMTYPFIPRTAVVGLIASMMGVKRNVAYTKEHFLYQAKIAIQCLNNPETLGFRTNLLRTKNPLRVGGANFFFTRNVENGYRSPQTEVFLKEPRFRIFITFDEREKLEELEQRLRDKEFHFIPYFGRANLFCFPEHVGWVKLAEGTSNKKKNLITIFEASKSQSVVEGQYTYVLSVPMNYQHVDKGKIELSKVAHIVYFTTGQSTEEPDSGGLVVESDELESFIISESPEVISDIAGKQITFLPYE
ncbi:MAG: type I-B CRISPR-associated protein Cas5b [Promethearchaeota archaeon]